MRPGTAPAWSWAFYFLYLVLAVMPSVQVKAQDSWLGEDKAKHFGASLLLASAGYAGSALVVEEPWQRAAIGGGFALALGVAKEIYDATGQGDPSPRDLSWDVMGCAFGVGVSLLLDYALRPTPEPALLPPTAAAW